MIEGIIITPLKVIPVDKGDVLHFLKGEELDNIREVYFSSVKRNVIKGWKKHNRMNMTLTVPVGSVKFAFFDSRSKSSTKGQTCSVVISKENYSKLLVPHGVWMAFQGLDEFNTIVNAASIMHDPEEQENKTLSDIFFEW